MSISAATDYEIGEPSYQWDECQRPAASSIFELRPPGVSNRAKPIYDEQLHAIIGYQDELAGISRIYSLDGTVSLIEEPLETPLFDPFDIVLMVGSFWRVGVKGFTRWGIRGLGASIGEHTLFGLRSRYYALAQAPLKFGAKPLKHMHNPKRFVPVHILRLAIRYGKRGPDPQNIKGLAMYKHAIRVDGKPYMLEILVREKDYTILHFLYEHIQ
jgi:hypothetical protein